MRSSLPREQLDEPLESCFMPNVCMHDLIFFLKKPHIIPSVERESIYNIHLLLGTKTLATGFCLPINVHNVFCFSTATVAELKKK